MVILRIFEGVILKIYVEMSEKTYVQENVVIFEEGIETFLQMLWKIFLLVI